MLQIIFQIELSRSVVSNSSTPWTVARQAPLCMGFPRQGYWSGLPFPSPSDLPYPGLKPMSLVSPELSGRSFPTSDTWEVQNFRLNHVKEFLKR